MKTKNSFCFKILGPVLLLFTSVNTQASLVQLRFDTLPTNTNDGTYNGFVGVTGDGTKSLSLICDDFIHTTYVPSGPTPFSLSKLTDLTSTRFGTQSLYEQASLLLYGDGRTDLAGLVNDPVNTSAYQYALWNLMEPGAAASEGYSDPGASALLAQVQSLALNSPDFQSLFSDLRIYTPIDGGTDQEFLGFAAETTSPTPEPSTWAMLLSGMVIGGVCLRKRILSIELT